MSARQLLVGPSLVGACLAGAGCSALRPLPGLPAIETHANRLAAGTLTDGVLTLDLEVARGVWHPDADDGPAIEILAFREAGGALQIPSPLLRVPEGTIIRVSLRNTLADSTIVVHGLMSRPGNAADSVVVPAGQQRTVEFLAGAPGTYFYAANLLGNDAGDRTGGDSQLGGALVVDSAGAKADGRVFVMGMWSQVPDSLAPDRPFRDIMVVNGKSWPHTERLDMALGDSVTWRWVNPTNSSHPMHLHGFFFDLESRGDWLQDTLFALDARPRMVTELMLPWNTMSMRWAPSQPGNWIFHCHFAFHVSPLASLTGNLALEAAARGDSSGLPHEHTAERAMNGLVMGIRVPVPEGWQAAANPDSARRIRLLLQTAPHRFGDSAGYGFVIPDGAEPPRDSIAIPGPALVLERGKPVSITVVNNLAEPSGVHWHGIELESYPDGVPGWSGILPKVMAPIAPGDSFIAEFTPPRAGTFIYHAHANEMTQLAMGLYGALLVVEPGTRPDPAIDHLVIVGLDGPTFRDSAAGLINGAHQPLPVVLAAGKPNRLRLININADHRVLFELVRDSSVTTWRQLAKDGADLPPVQVVARRATLLTGPGETADFEIVPRAGDQLRLVVSGPYHTVPWTRTVALEVR